MAQGDVVNSATEENIGNSTSNTIALGATATIGNLLVSTCTWDKDAQLTGNPTCRDASGSGDFWTVIYVESSDLNSSSALAYKISDGDETQCFWSWSESEDCSCTLYEYEGPFLDDDPLDKQATAFDAGIVTTLTVGPTATLASTDQLCVICGGQDSHKALEAIDGVWVERAILSTAGNGDPSHLMGTKIVSSTAAVSGTLSSNGGDEWSGVLATFELSVNPAYAMHSFGVYKDAV